MIKGFETNDNERAEAAYIIYALLKSRPENSSVNQSNQKFIDWGAFGLSQSKKKITSKYMFELSEYYHKYSKQYKKMETL